MPKVEEHTSRKRKYAGKQLHKKHAKAAALTAALMTSSPEALEVVSADEHVSASTMPKVEKQTSRKRKYAGQQPQKEIVKDRGHSTSPTPPPSPGAEKRAQEEWLQRHKALAARIDVETAKVQGVLDKLEDVKKEHTAALEEMSDLGKENTVMQPGVFDDSSSDSEESDSVTAESALPEG
jgi:hypothetical protein